MKKNARNESLLDESLIDDAEERQPLLQEKEEIIEEGTLLTKIKKKEPYFPKLVEAIYFVPVINAATGGMAKSYSTFGLIAIFYDSGLWLLAPVIGGGVIGFSHETFKRLLARYPENSKIKFLANASSLANLGLVGFLEDFGFSWMSLLMVAAPTKIQNPQTFEMIIAPAVSLLPAALLRYVRYRQHSQTINNYIEIAAYTIFGAISPTFLLRELRLQNQLSEASVIPIAVIAASGMFGFSAGLMRKYYWKLALTLSFLIEVLAANPSLATAFLSFPDDLYSAENDGEVSEGFFFTTVGLSSIYLLMLTLLSVATAITSYQEVKELKERELEYKNLPNYDKTTARKINDEEIHEIFYAPNEERARADTDSALDLKRSENSNDSDDELEVKRGCMDFISDLLPALARKDSLTYIKINPDPELVDLMSDFMVIEHETPSSPNTTHCRQGKKASTSQYKPRFLPPPAIALDPSTVKEDEADESFKFN